MPMRLTRAGVKSTTLRTKWENESQKPGRGAGLEAGRLHGVKAGDENLDAGVTGEADGVGLQRERGLRGAGRGEGAVLIDELDDGCAMTAKPTDAGSVR